MKKFIIVVTIILTCVFTNMTDVNASSVNNYKQQYFASLLSMAAYNDKYTASVKDALTAYGWEFLPDKKGNIQLKDILLAHNSVFAAGEDSYFLAFKGTENYNDVKKDIKIEMIPFNNGEKEVYRNKEMPLVHGGFYNNCVKLLAQPIDGNALNNYLLQLLARKPTVHLYITGHSLGGAEAALAAAQLIKLGASPLQISVISFGAPAVGNEKFVQEYGSKINLQRVIMKGDPVRNLAQIVDRRYKLFGREIKYSQVSSDDEKISHKIILYVDRALRQYYADGYKYSDNMQLKSSVLFTKPIFHIPSEQQKENVNVYLQNALADIARHNINNSYISNTSYIMKFNYKYVVTTDITIKRQQQVRNSFYTAINYTIYKVESSADLPLFLQGENDSVQKGYTPLSFAIKNDKSLKLLTSVSASADTLELTPIEAVLYNSSKLQLQLKHIIE